MLLFIITSIMHYSVVGKWDSERYGSLVEISGERVFLPPLLWHF